MLHSDPVPVTLDIFFQKCLCNFKNLYETLSKIKKPVTTPLFHLPPSKSFPSSTSWIRRANKHPKAPPFVTSNDRENNHIRKDDVDDDEEAATLSDIDCFLREDFESLYKNDLVGEEVNDKDGGVKKRNEERTTSYFCDSPTFTTPPPSFIRKGPRFHVPQEFSGSLIHQHVDAGWSAKITANHHNINNLGDYGNNNNKVVDDSKYRATGDDEEKETVGIKNFMAISTFSQSPCDDFQHSMHEMVESRLQRNGKINWEFMEELLFCYLDLNDKKSHKYILSAFVDVHLLRENYSK